jgi:hypothetical protein
MVENQCLSGFLATKPSTMGYEPLSRAFRRRFRALNMHQMSLHTLACGALAGQWGRFAGAQTRRPLAHGQPSLGRMGCVWLFCGGISAAGIATIHFPPFGELAP